MRSLTDVTGFSRTIIYMRWQGMPLKNLRGGGRSSDRTKVSVQPLSLSSPWGWPFKTRSLVGSCLPVPRLLNPCATGFQSGLGKQLQGEERG